jgi:hypothetical protein
MLSDQIIGTNKLEINFMQKWQNKDNKAKPLDDGKNEFVENSLKTKIRDLKDKIKCLNIKENEIKKDIEDLRNTNTRNPRNQKIIYALTAIVSFAFVSILNIQLGFL